MSYEINNYSGYLINIKDLIKGFPQLESHESAEYVLRGGSGGIDDGYAFENSLKSMLIEKVYEDLDINDIELIGKWSIEQISGGTYWLGLNEGNIYLKFSKEQLINLVRIDGQSTETKSTSLIKLEDFLTRNEIPLDALHYEEWVSCC